ncbi:MAG TPA: glycosyltransferase [Chitinophagales bacterium]|nr:glycosyltransferase [Chitinophagales bacterium]
MADKPKLLVTTTSFPRWQHDTVGGGTFFIELLQPLSKQAEIHVLAPHFKGAPPYAEIEQIKVHRYKFFPFNAFELINQSGLAETLSRHKWKLLLVPFLLFFQLLNIHRLVKRHGISLIHAHWTIPQGIVAAFYKKFFNRSIKLLVTSHGSDLNMSFGSLGKNLNRFVLRNADALTVVSNALKEKAEKLGCAKAINVIPMGVNTDLFRHTEASRALREKLGIRKWMLLFVGYFYEVKGIEYLLRAMPQIVKQQPETTLVLAGDGILRKKLTALANELGISSQVRFVGLVAPSLLPAYYSAADIVLMPSLEEGFGLVWAEAMSCASLVIASDINVFKTHILDGETGFLVKAKDEMAIAGKVVEVLGSIDKWHHVRNHARNYVQANFSWNIIASKYSAIISQLSEAGK